MVLARHSITNGIGVILVQAHNIIRLKTFPVHLLLPMLALLLKFLRYCNLLHHRNIFCTKTRLKLLQLVNILQRTPLDLSSLQLLIGIRQVHPL